MIRKIASAAIIAGMSMSFVAAAHATDIPATPMNKGPMPMTGIPGGDLLMSGVGAGVGVVDAVAAPPMNAVNTALGNSPAPMAEAAPMRRHRMMRHHMHHKMMHKKMMKKEM